MTTSRIDEQGLPELPPEVVDRIVDELSSRGEKAVTCLRTAAALIKQAVDDDRGLRLAESAGYNLREALDAVVTGRPPVSGGLSAILEAWARYQSEVAQPDADMTASLSALEDALHRVAENRDRSSYHAARLLGYLRDKTGVDPLQGEADPIGEYNRLRNDANTALHAESALDAVTALYDRTVAWFIRMFTPPDAVVTAISELAAEPWQGVEQIGKLRELATNPHHLRLFLGRLTDPAWLNPVYDAGLLKLPQPDTAWPAASLLEGLGRSSPDEVAGLLERMLADSNALRQDRRLGARFELLRVASQIGAAGHSVVARIVELHANVRAVRALTFGVVKRADPTDPVILRAADAMLSGEPFDRDDYYAGAVLDRLAAGLDAGNVAERTRMLSAKVRRLARHPDMRFVALDIARLTADLGEERGYLAKVTHYLARMLSRARELGVPTADLLDWTKSIPGAIGERITCRILAEANDVSLQDKIDHITQRLASSTCTGDDRDLVTSVLNDDPEADALAAWHRALGTPSAAPENPASALPDDWARAWRWSMVLPASLLAEWREPIAQVTARHGEPDPQALDRRSERFELRTGQSAHSEDELTALPVIEAAELIASWRPDAASDARMLGARELARTLEAVVKANPDRWSIDPVAVVTALHEPVYVLHYLRALTDLAGEITPRAPQILNAAELARTTRWEPALLGRDDFDFEPGWHNVDTTAVDLLAALANKSADLTGHLETAWAWALELIDCIPDADDDAGEVEISGGDSDALFHAINHPRGRGLQAVLALAGWERRQTGTIRAEFTQLLDELVRMPGRVGMQYRAILVEHRVFLEAVAPAWLEQNTPTLFSDDDRGRETFDLTLKYARPTSWFYRHFRSQIFAAARRGAVNAVGCLLVGALNGEDGYSSDTIIEGLRGDTTALASAANEIAYLVQSSQPGTPELETAVTFWRALLEADRRVVPAEALQASGRWALVTGLSDDVWTEQTVQTLELTGGAIDLPIEVADRCKAATSSGDSTKILLLLLGQGEPWEQDYVARAGVEKLRTLARRQVDESFWRLRTRLIELGYHQAADVTPATGPGPNDK
ncbi:hypothetical protein ACVCAH_36450 [Micromonospora sp. LZ34]